MKPFDHQRLENLKQNELHHLVEQAELSPWRERYHIQPVTGCMASPAAFIYCEGIYHLFYNWHPVSSNNGINYWYHVTSKDLISFHNEGVKLKPDDLYDYHGLTSGSAVEVGEEVFFFYTGFFEDGEGDISPLQLVSRLGEDGKIHKHPVPLIEMMPEAVKYMAQPSVYKHGDNYYMLLGAETKAGYGGIAVYHAVGKLDFKYLGLLATGLDTFGDIWEHPQIFQVDGYDVLAFCPQGIDKFGYNFWNVYQSGFVIGEIDFEQLTLNHGTFYEFDYGFDFYAPRTTVDEEGQCVMIGLLGMQETSYPTDEDLWGNCLSLPRVLNIEDYKLKQRPHPKLEALRHSLISAEGYFKYYPKRMRDFYGDKYELIIDFLDYDATEIYVKLRVSKKEETVIIYNTEHDEITLDTTFSGRMPEGVDGTERKLKLQQKLHQLRIFMDVSSIEVFINDGDRVMSARIFPSKEAVGVQLSTEIGECYVEMAQYKLREEIGNEKIIHSWRGSD